MLINTVDGIDDDFRGSGPLSGGWLVGNGSWMVEKAPGAAADVSGTLKVNAVGTESKALIGDRKWRQYEVSADVDAGSAAAAGGSGVAGIVLLHRDEGNYYSALVDNGVLRLMRVVDGQETLADSEKLNVAGAVTLSAAVKHGHIMVTARPAGDASAPVAASVQFFDGETMLKGRAGLIA